MFYPENQIWDPYQAICVIRSSKHTPLCDTGEKDHSCGQKRKGIARGLPTVSKNIYKVTNGYPFDDVQLLTKSSFTVVFTLGCRPFLILLASCVAAKLVYCLLWTSKCDFKPEVWVNRLPHKSQANGFSPEWMRMCTLRLPDWVKVLKQQGHWYGRSPLWILMWTYRQKNQCSKFVVFSTLSLLSVNFKRENEMAFTVLPLA